MLIQLNREANISGQGMFGTLTVGDFSCLTVEREWLDNKPNISCIPEGTYHLVPHKWRGRYQTYALVGSAVSHWPQTDFARNLVLIHPANISGQLQGCIALGSGRGFLKGQYSVTNSTNTTNKFLDILAKSGDQDHVLIIKNSTVIS